MSELTVQGANGGIALCLKGVQPLVVAIVRERHPGAASASHLGHEIRPQIASRPSMPLSEPWELGPTCGNAYFEFGYFKLSHYSYADSKTV
ncbi:hypothetical protein [Mesorhizobium delmotii]|uniref:hypothetical protein n=1 Tax=Mesorhizobium delmotii TaxID=1631247 RepID=UPI0010582219|nr:hypothetical protein [Mesorhizobium delmotii]